MTREQLEAKLGNADNFVCTFSNLSILKQWALAIGEEPVHVHAMSNVDLSNLYHERGPGGNGKSKPVQRDEDADRLAMANMVLQILEVMQPGVSGVAAIRSMIREEIPTTDTLRALARAVYDNLPPVRLEVCGPAGDAILQGPMHYLTKTVIRVCALAHPIMMVGPAGCGKTTIAKHTSTALKLPFYITSTVNDTHELMGFVDGYGKYNQTPFRRAFENGGIWVADEIDAWDAAALLTANSALANGFATFPDNPEPVMRHEHFRMIATANTFGHGADRQYVGRNELDAASLDRFAVIEVDYDAQLEERLSNGNPRWLRRVLEVRNAVQEKNIRHVVSSRAIMFGSEALAAGFTQAETEKMYLFKGMSKSDREKIK